MFLFTLVVEGVPGWIFRPLTLFRFSKKRHIRCDENFPQWYVLHASITVYISP